MTSFLGNASKGACQRVLFTFAVSMHRTSFNGDHKLLIDYQPLSEPQFSCKVPPHSISTYIVVTEECEGGLDRGVSKQD